MITKINISDIATYRENQEIIPTEINYLYGNNGSGKTTLSKLISDPSQYISCSLEWDIPVAQTLVYNRDFVRENFSQSTSIKGIFTLGKDTTEAKQFIEEKKHRIDQLDTQIRGNKQVLENKDNEKKILKDELSKKCWSLKQKYESIFKPAFTGHIGSKDKFLEKCLEEHDNSTELLTGEGIKSKCEKIFSESLTQYSMFEEFTYTNLKQMENDEILKIKIIGKESIPIGDLIKQLNNSDWVKQGIEYADISYKVCPFCQQVIPSTLKEELENFFDETYLKKCKELGLFRERYSEYIATKIQELERVAQTEIAIINFDNLIQEISLVKLAFNDNLSRIDSKIKSPSLEIQLSSLEGEFQRVAKIIDDYRKIIVENNKIVINISQEKQQLNNYIWRYLTNLLDMDIKLYKLKVAGIRKAESNLKQSIVTKEQEKKTLRAEISNRENDVTSVTPTVNEINRILRLFGFNNFSLAEADEAGFYKIIRANGEYVNETLSEGEYTFITFLYFYKLIRGSMDRIGVENDKIVVIDDPISSLDSNVLFIVSNLVKEIIRDCQEGKSGIKQIFVLTHNVYFHKEITFKGGRESNTAKESFWIVRKLNDISVIRKQDNNPIQTTYELLWRELEDPESINIATIFNTLRRILEYYFNILGGIKYEDCINAFEGEDKFICKSLVSWINDGSHFISDDLEMPVEVDQIQKYLSVFKMIFEKMGHIKHYEMMMNRGA